MEVLLEIHLVVAFLAALCAVVFSWNALGRRVVTAVVTLQFIIGLVLAGTLGSTLATLGAAIWIHLAVGIVVLGLYGMAMGAAKRPGGSNRALLFSIAGMLLIFFNVYLGWHMAGKV
jgi:uncharacterized membrane protein YcaP (DUF421 family)